MSDLVTSKALHFFQDTTIFAFVTLKSTLVTCNIDLKFGGILWFALRIDMTIRLRSLCLTAHACSMDNLDIKSDYPLDASIAAVTSKVLLRLYKVFFRQQSGL